MKPVEQSRIGEDGRCFPACLASILELPEVSVPDLDNTNETQVNGFLASHGLRYQEIPIDADTPIPVGWHVICGVSPRGGMHAVVGRDGEFIHDPHPVSDDPRRGVVKPERWGLLLPTVRTQDMGEMYHVTHTSNVPSIQKKGIKPVQPSNWKRAATGRRYGQGEVNAFTNRTDALRWAAKMDWEFNQKTGSGAVSIVRFDDKDNLWHVDKESDPLTQHSYKGPWMKSKTKVPAANVKAVEPFTPKHAKQLVNKWRGKDAHPFDYQWGPKDAANLRAIISNLKATVSMIESAVPVTPSRQKEADQYKVEIREWERLLAKCGVTERRGARDRADMMALRRNTAKQGGPFHVQLTEPNGKEHTESVHALRAYDADLRPVPPYKTVTRRSK